jgi:hypothetical protein
MSTVTHAVHWVMVFAVPAKKGASSWEPVDFWQPFPAAAALARALIGGRVS